jgi:hypothetical protein
MNNVTYNLSLLIGTLMIGGGIAMVSIPAALVTVGAMIIGLTVFGAYISGRKP